MKLELTCRIFYFTHTLFTTANMRNNHCLLALLRCPLRGLLFKLEQYDQSENVYEATSQNRCCLHIESREINIVFLFNK